MSNARPSSSSIVAAPAELDVVVRIVGVEDRHARARVALQVAVLAAAGDRRHEHVVAVAADPHRRRLRSAVGVDRREHGEVAAVEQPADLVVQRDAHAATTWSSVSASVLPSGSLTHAARKRPRRTSALVGPSRRSARTRRRARPCPPSPRRGRRRTSRRSSRPRRRRARARGRRRRACPRRTCSGRRPPRPRRAPAQRALVEALGPFEVGDGDDRLDPVLAQSHAGSSLRAGRSAKTAAMATPSTSPPRAPALARVLGEEEQEDEERRERRGHVPAARVRPGRGGRRPRRSPPPSTAAAGSHVADADPRDRAGERRRGSRPALRSRCISCAPGASRAARRRQAQPTWSRSSRKPIAAAVAPAAPSRTP